MDRIFTIYALVIKFNAFKHSISPNFHSHSIRNLRNELRLMVLFRFENDHFNGPSKLFSPAYDDIFRSWTSRLFQPLQKFI